MEFRPISHNPTISTIATSSATGKGGEIDRDIIKSVFGCIKALGLDGVYKLCELKQSSTCTAEDIQREINDAHAASSNQPRMDWLDKLDNEGLKKVQDIIQVISNKKREILDTLKTSDGRYEKVEIVSFYDTVSWVASRQVFAIGGYFYLNEGIFSFERNTSLLSCRDFVKLCSGELTDAELRYLNVIADIHGFIPHPHLSRERAIRAVNEIINYVYYSVENKSEYIRNNREIAIQLLCVSNVMPPQDKYLIWSLFKNHMQDFFDICHVDLVCPGISFVKETQNKKDINITALQRDTSPDKSEFEHLPFELRFRINEELSLKNRTSLSSTNKFCQQDYEKICLGMLKNTPVIEELLKHGLSAATLFRKNPSYRKDEYVLSNWEGVIYVVEHVKVMGPLTLQQIIRGELTLEEARIQRSNFDLTEQEKSPKPTEAETLSRRYFLDGSIAEHDSIRKLTDNVARCLGAVNKRDWPILIDCGLLTIEECLHIKPDRWMRLYELYPLIIYKKLTTEEALALAMPVHSRYTRRGIQQLVINDKLTLKQCQELSHKEIEFVDLFYDRVLEDEITAKELLALFNVLPDSGWRYWHSRCERYLGERKTSNEDGSDSGISIHLTLKEAIFLLRLDNLYELGRSEIDKVIKHDKWVQHFFWGLW